jgi:hypothetical protein
LDLKRSGNGIASIQTQCQTSLRYAVNLPTKGLALPGGGPKRGAQLVRRYGTLWSGPLGPDSWANKN